jgi:arsenate reductase
MRITLERSYQELGDKKQNSTDEQLIEVFAQDTMLIKRPLIVKDRVVILENF